MFTGLVQEIGSVASVDGDKGGSRLRIETKLSGELAEGDSISVGGTCLTAARIENGAFEADVMGQTLSLTTLGGLQPGDAVNLELALRASDRLGGHIVQGHGDGVGEVAAVEEDGFAQRVRVRLGADLMRYVVEKGSIAVNGVSLTVVDVDADAFSVSLIPETLERTTLGNAAPGAPVNLEVDVVAKYVEKLVAR